ncbi:MAG TPA: hypothetical protein VM537_18395, partial [Anaerolineae bacterium]|nr:hypothetical protein [Anaerolineae bacterium]
MGGETKLGIAQVPIQADMTGLDKDLDAAKKKIADGLEKAAAGANASLAKIGNAGKLIAGGFLAAGAAALKFASDAAPIQGVQKTFQNLGGDIAVMRSSMSDMVDDVSLMKSFNSAAQLIGPTFAKQLPDAMGYLSKVAAATGQDMGFMVDSLVKGVGRLSPMILDNLGIQVALSDATARASQMYGVQTDALTKAQVQAGMMSVVIEKLKNNTAAMPEVLGTTAQQAAAFSTSMKNLKDQVGLALIPALNAVLPAAEKIAGALANMVNAPGFQDGIQRVADAVAGLLDWLTTLDPATLKVAGSAIALAVALPKVVTAVTAVKAAMLALNVVMAANPIVLIAMGIVAAGLAIAAVIQRIKTVEAENKAAIEQTDATALKSTQTYAEYVASMEAVVREKYNVHEACSAEQLALIGVEEGIIRTKGQWESYQILMSKAEGPALGGLDEGMMSVRAQIQGVGDDLLQVAGKAPSAADAMRNAASQISEGWLGMRQTMAASSAEMGELMSSVISTEPVRNALAEIQNITAEHQAAMAQIEEQGAQTRADAQFNYQLQAAQDEQKFQQEHAALLVAGKGEEAAQLESSFATQQAQAANQYNIQGQLQERALLQQRVTQQTAYVQQLQDQQDQVLRTLALEMQKAEGWAGISAEEQNTLLSIVYSGGSDRLKAEFQNAQDLLGIEKSLAEGKVQSAQAQVEAILAIQKAQQGEAASALADLKNKLAGFKVALPPLPPIDVSQVSKSAGAAMGGAAKKTEESATRTLKSVTEDISKTVDIATSVLGKLTDIQVPESARQGIQQLADFIRETTAVMYAVAGDVDAHTSKMASKMSKALALITDSFIQFVQAGQLFERRPDMGNIGAWFDVYILLGNRMMLAVAQLEASLGGSNAAKKTIQNAKRWSEFFKTVATFLQRIGETRFVDLAVWQAQVQGVVELMMQTIEYLQTQFGAARIQKASELTEPLVKMAELMSIDLERVKATRMPNLDDVKANLIAALTAGLDVVQTVVTLVGAFNITQAAAKVADLQSVLNLISTELSKVKPAEGDFAATAYRYVGQLQTLFGFLFDYLNSLSTDTRDAYHEAVGIMPDIEALAGMVGAIDLSKIVPSTSATFETDVDTYFSQQEMVGSRAMDGLSRISEAWRRALAAAVPVVEDIKAVIGLGGATDLSKIVPSESATFEADVDKRFAQQEYIGGRAMNWLMRISDVWRAALAEAAPVVENIKAVLGLAGATDVTAIAVSESASFEADVDKRFAQQEYIGSRAVRWISRISDVWRQALADMQPTIEHVKNVLSLGGAADLEKMIPSESKTFEADVDARFGQLEYVGGVIVGWLSRISEPWRRALAELAPVAENIQKVFAVTQIGTDVAAVDRGTFVTRVVSHLSAMIEATPLVKTALETIKGQWISLEAMAEDAGLSETIQKFFSILDLSKTFEELQVVKPIQQGERRTALSNVIANFILQLKAAAPMLKTGLAEVEALFEGTMDQSIAIAEKIAKVFEAIASAIKAGVEATTQKDWNLGALLNIIGQLSTA